MDRENPESNEISKPWPNSIKAQVKFLLHETLRRYPGQQYPKETLQAWQEDWTQVAIEIGIERFGEAVRRARSYCKFFPTVAEIREYVAAPKLADGEKWNQELRQLQRRKEAGEKFYTIGDVLETFADQIRSGKVKPRDPGWIEWAKNFKGDKCKATH